MQLSSIFQQSLKSGPKKFEHHQKETYTNRWDKNGSTTNDSAHVASRIDTQTHSCINLSSSDKIDELINNLNQLHKQLDDKIKDRTNQISKETESVLSHIMDETQQKQQRLLSYAKDQQLKQDENYQKLLQEYISQLDEMKAKELADLQKQLQYYREQILDESQLKIMAVNGQANIIKGKILEEEQYQASTKIDSIISEIRKLATDEKVQHLGSEIKTETNIITNASVGTKASGQECVFDSHLNNQTEQRSQPNRKNTGKR